MCVRVGVVWAGDRERGLHWQDQDRHGRGRVRVLPGALRAHLLAFLEFVVPFLHLSILLVRARSLPLSPPLPILSLFARSLALAGALIHAYLFMVFWLMFVCMSFWPALALACRHAFPVYACLFRSCVHTCMSFWLMCVCVSSCRMHAYMHDSLAHVCMHPRVAGRQVQPRLQER